MEHTIQWLTRRKGKWANNDSQNTILTEKYELHQNQHELWSSGRIKRFRSTSGTRLYSRYKPYDRVWIRNGRHYDYESLLCSFLVISNHLSREAYKQPHVLENNIKWYIYIYALLKCYYIWMESSQCENWSLSLLS